MVHDVLKRLKIGDTGSITCTKEFPPEEVRLYVTAYAFHKKKWFAAQYDKVSNTVRCSRGEMPSWVKLVEDDKEEEL